MPGPAPRPALLDLRAQDGEQAIVVPGLQDKVAHTPVHGFHGQLDASPGRHRHHRERLVQSANSGQQVQTFLAGRGIPGVVEVHEQEVEDARFERADKGCRRARRLDFVPVLLEQQAQSFQNRGLIVGDQGSGRG